MKIDFDSWQGQQIADTQMAILDESQEINLISTLKPEFHKDGNMYCFTYPSIEGLPNDCIQGFGETARMAAIDFNTNWYQNKA